MDEGRKRVLWICATILAAPRLASLERDKNPSLQVDIIYDAIVKAEAIINSIDHRWPTGRVAGKT